MPSEQRKPTWWRVMHYDSYARILRIGRLRWGRREGPGFSRKLTIALVPKLFRVSRDVKPSPRTTPPHGYAEWRVTLLGIRLHYERDMRGVLE